MIGIAFACYDGRKKAGATQEEKKYDYQVENKLTQLPTLLEILGHNFILGTYFLGPQTSLAKYRRALERNQSRHDLLNPGKHILKTLTKGTMFMTAYFIGLSNGPSIEDVRDSTGFIKSLAMTYWWTLVITWKYAGALHISEGASMLSGVAYNGEKKVNGVVIVDWSGCRSLSTKVVYSINVHPFSQSALYSCEVCHYPITITK